MKVFITALICAMTVNAAKAQSLFNISVSQEQPYIDHLTLAENTYDMDMMIKFVFDEEKNQLSVSLISYQHLFVFREDTKYKPAIKRRRIRTEMLPYVATEEKGSKFQLAKQVYRAIPKPKKKYIFKRWINYEGLQPVPQEYQMVNDFVEQTFDIVNKKDTVRITLGDVFLMQHASDKPKDLNKYKLFFGKNLDREYIITILRDPCFGQSEGIAAANAALETVKKAYKSFYSKFQGKIIDNKEEFQIFKELKGLLTAQFMPKDTLSKCDSVQNAWDEYNAYTDSLRNIKCKYVPAPPPPTITDGADGEAAPKIGSDHRVILSAARQLDRSVAKWLLSKDPLEKQDIRKLCNNIINNTNKMIKAQGLINEEQRRAYAVYKAAVSYYNSKCR